MGLGRSFEIMKSESAEPRAVGKPALPPTEITQFFWDAAREHKLAIQRCDDCKHYVHWPQVRCPNCQSDRLSPSQVSGKGEIYSFCVVHHVFHPGFAADVPYNVAIVELDEEAGLRMIANILDCPNEALYVGMPVEVTFEDREGYTLPQFRPAVGAGVQT